VAPAEEAVSVNVYVPAGVPVAAEGGGPVGVELPLLVTPAQDTKPKDRQASRRTMVQPGLNCGHGRVAGTGLSGGNNNTASISSTGQATNLRQDPVSTPKEKGPMTEPAACALVCTLAENMAGAPFR
jgi:hypothetical protein